MLRAKHFYSIASFALVSLLCFPVFGQFLVTNTNDSGAGSLRAGISSGGVIDFDPVLFATPQTITLATPFPLTFSSFSINGPGTNLLTVDGTFQNDEIFFIQGGVVNLSGITLSGASNAPTATDLTNGIFLRGNLTLDDVVIRDFQSQGVFSQSGNLTVTNSTITNNGENGIFASGFVRVENSTITNNAENGIFNRAATTVINSTIANNVDDGVFSQFGSVLLNNSTIVNNGGAGVFAGGTTVTTINSSIIANHLGADLTGFGGFPGATITASNSLIESTSFFTNGVNGNIVGLDPMLGPLGNNGGDTQTFLLTAGSPAIDAGSNPQGLTQDQRGVSRVIGSQADIGATEFVVVPEPTGLGLIFAVGLAFLAGRNKRTT